MSKTIYNYFDFDTTYPFALLLCLILGIYLLWLALHKIGDAEVSYQQHPILVKDLPFVGRLVAQGLPIILGSVLVLFGSINLFNLGRFYIEYSLGEFEEIEGQIQVIEVEQSNGRDRELYSIVFSIDDVIFDSANTYSPEEKAFFDDGCVMRVQYGYVGKHLMIYKIFLVATNETTSENLLMT